MEIILNESISLGDLRKILYENASLAIADEARERIQKSYEFLKEFSSDKVIYGINTGFGPMAQWRIDDEYLNDLQ